MVASGSTLVIHHEFVPARVVQSLDEEAITMTTMVPAMIQARLVVVPDIATRKFEKLRLISYGASPIAQETLQKAKVSIWLRIRPGLRYDRADLYCDQYDSGCA